MLIRGISMEPSSLNTLFEFAGTMIASLVAAIMVYKWRFRIQDCARLVDICVDANGKCGFGESGRWRGRLRQEQVC